MTIEQGLTTSFRKELPQAIHNLLADTIKVALYDGDATLTRATTVYSATNEVAGTNYTAGGVALTGIAISEENKVAIITFDNPEWPNATISARAALVYNASKANRSIAVIDFGDLVSAVAELFRLKIPAADANQAVFRIP